MSFDFQASAGAWITPLPHREILVACSGGADSMALLHYARTLLQAGSLDRLACAHFNHNLRTEAVDDENFVRGFCLTSGIEFFKGEADVAAEAARLKRGIEETARVLRYGFLESVAVREGFPCVCTAHNRDDNMETMLFNLTRGTGPSGLCGIKQTRGIFFRPMLDITRAEIEAYIAQNGVNHIEDASNADTCYSRNKLRHLALPVLREINSAAAEAFSRTAEFLRADEDYFELETARILSTAIQTPEGLGLPVNILSELHPAMAGRVCRALCAKAGIIPEAVHIRDMLGLLGKFQPAMINLPKGVVARRRKKMLIVGKTGGVPNG